MPWATKRATQKAPHTWPKNRTPYAGSGWAWQRLRQAVLERDGHRCRWCGGGAVTADHVLARAFGGLDVMANLVASCKPCNMRRAHQQSKEGQRRAVALRQRAPGRALQPRAVTQW